MNLDRKRRYQKDGRNEGGKTIVLGMLGRKGKVRAKVVKNRKGEQFSLSLRRRFIKTR